MEKFPWLKLSKVVVNLEVIIHSFEMLCDLWKPS